MVEQCSRAFMSSKWRAYICDKGVGGNRGSGKQLKSCGSNKFISRRNLQSSTDSIISSKPERLGDVVVGLGLEYFYSGNNGEAEVTPHCRRWVCKNGWETNWNSLALTLLHTLLFCLQSGHGRPSKKLFLTLTLNSGSTYMILINDLGLHKVVMWMRKWVLRVSKLLSSE